MEPNQQTPRENSGQANPNSKQKTLAIIKWALTVGIVVVMNLFFNYAVSLVYEAPKYEGFCPVKIYNKAYVDKQMCVSSGGMWSENTAPVQGKYPQPVLTQPEVTGYCNPTYTCGNQFADAQKVYNKNVFIVLVIFGILSIILGVYLSGISVVSLGISFGGILSLIIGSVRYWSDMQDWLRVAVLGVALVTLIWLGIKKIKE